MPGLVKTCKELFDTENLYEVRLGIDKSANASQIKKAYHKRFSNYCMQLRCDNFEDTFGFTSEEFNDTEETYGKMTASDSCLVVTDQTKKKAIFEKICSAKGSSDDDDYETGDEISSLDVAASRSRTKETEENVAAASDELAEARQAMGAAKILGKKHNWRKYSFKSIDEEEDSLLFQK